MNEFGFWDGVFMFVLLVGGGKIVSRFGYLEGHREGYDKGWNDALDKVAEINSLEELSLIFERLGKR